MSMSERRGASSDLEAEEEERKKTMKKKKKGGNKVERQS